MTGLGKTTPRGSLTTSSVQPVYSTPNQPFEDVLLRQRTLGQDILPSAREPKRTESLYTPQKPTPAGGSAAAPSTGAGFFGKSGKLKVCKTKAQPHFRHNFRFKLFRFFFLFSVSLFVHFISVIDDFNSITNKQNHKKSLTKCNPININTYGPAWHNSIFQTRKKYAV